MLIPPLARACRPGLRQPSLRPCLPFPAARVFTNGPIHRKDAHGQRPSPPPPGHKGHAPPQAPTAKVTVEHTKTTQPVQHATKPAKAADPLAPKEVSNAEQRKADWRIMKEMSRYLWPKDDIGTRLRVGISVGLLVGAKLLNVQIPFYFKSIVDTMNIDFLAVGGTAWTVAGSMIVACKLFGKLDNP